MCVINCSQMDNIKQFQNLFQIAKLNLHLPSTAISRVYYKIFLCRVSHFFKHTVFTFFHKWKCSVVVLFIVPLFLAKLF